ncbi:hypothetical protein B5F28_13840 [Gemmiger sp. An194]|nr:hypothetical protein B5F28_13840 [Gemmiger sp. An194]
MVSLLVLLAVFSPAMFFAGGILWGRREKLISVALVILGVCGFMTACAAFFGFDEDYANGAIKCPECGNTYYDGQMFCSDDGTELEKEVR